ncbi:MAG: hypothetical protein EZS28_043749, partial [Streblomastix strix]
MVSVESYFTNEIEQALIANAEDYAFSAESMTLWVYNEQYQWVNTNVDNPSEVIPKSSTIPKKDGQMGEIGEETTYAAGDHIHPMNTSTAKPLMNSSDGSAGSAATYARSDHVHPIDSNLMLNSILGVQGEGNAITDIQVYENQLVLYKLATFIDTVSTQTITGAKTFTTPISIYEATPSDLLTSGGYKSETNFVRTTNAVDETITGTKTFNNNVIAAGFKTPSGTDQQLLLANGSTKPLSELSVNDSNYVKKTGQTVQVIDGKIRKGIEEDQEESEDSDNEYFLTYGQMRGQFVTLDSQQTITDTKTFNNNVIAAGFKTPSGTAIDVLLTDGTTAPLNNKISRAYSSGAGGYIRLCVFPIGTSIGSPYIQFKVTCNTNSMQTIDLFPQYTVNGIIDLYGKITAPQY